VIVDVYLLCYELFIVDLALSLRFDSALKVRSFQFLLSN